MGEVQTPLSKCNRCNKVLSPDEAHYYGNTCDSCERDMMYGRQTNANVLQLRHMSTEVAGLIIHLDNELAKAQKFMEVPLPKCDGQIEAAAIVALLSPHKDTISGLVNILEDHTCFD